MNFGNEITKILATQSYCPSECEVPEVLVLGGVPKGKPIVATKLPKMGEKKYCGNGIAEIEGKEKKNCGN